jgi:hypothetical protein
MQNVMIEVNVGDEPQKSGVVPADAPRLLDWLRKLESLRVTGLMAIPPVGEPDLTRRYFAKMRELREALDLPVLSMGMSDDFELAIAEGSTLIRVGRAIFGSRG